LNGAPANRIYEARGNFGQRQQHKSTSGKMRVWYVECGLLNYLVAIEYDIDIEGSRTFAPIADTTIFFFDLETTAKKLVGIQFGCGFESSIQKPRLIQDISRLRGINRSTSNDVDTTVGKSTNTSAQMLFAGAEIRTECQINTVHENSRYHDTT